jgi:hypothetical protein
MPPHEDGIEVKVEDFLAYQHLLPKYQSHKMIT